MKQLMLGLVILALAASTGFAHGGTYRGPAGEVPPNMRKPEDPPPPSDSGTPTPPPEENPGTPTPPDNGQPRPQPAPPQEGQGPDQGGARVIPPPPGGSSGGTATPGGNSRAGPPPLTYDSWEFWWGYNKDDILNLKGRLKNLEGGINTERALSAAVGPKVAGAKSDTQAPTELAIQGEIIPALEEALSPDLNFDIRASAVIGLGKIGSTQQAQLQGSIAKRLIETMNNESEEFSVQESAALALGLLQGKDEDILKALCDKLLDRRAKHPRTRAFAAIALGLLQVKPTDAGYERVTETLKSILKSDREALADIPVCCLVAMGLSGDRNYVPDLVAMVRDSRAYKTVKMNDLTRAYAAAAIGKIAETDPETVKDKDVVDVLKKALIGTGAHTVRSAVIAFGQIGANPGVDKKQLGDMANSLLYFVKKNEEASNFALISLGRIAGATDDRRLRNTVYDALFKEMTKGSYSTKPFAALALGLMGRSAGVDQGTRDVIKERVRFEFDNFRGDPKNRGAYAIALGMLEDRGAVDSLVKVLQDKTGLKRLRGSCAVALGMIRDKKASGAIKEALQEPQDRDLRVDTAVAAGLLGDTDTIPSLVEILKDSRSSLFVQGSVTLALGRIGDKRAIEPLLELLKDANGQVLNRALAAVALGNLGDRNDVPVLSRLSKDVNYRATIPSMEEVLSIL